MTKHEIENIDIDQLVADRETFSAFVYTPLTVAVEQLHERAKDAELRLLVQQAVGNDLPKILHEGLKKAVLFRQIATPNYEIRRFLQIIDTIDGFEPLFGEYSDDTFLAINEVKKHWGKILYFENDDKFQNCSKIIDFKESEGKKISEVKTKRGDSLVDFHHDLFEKTFLPVKKKAFYNISEWIATHGKTAKNYYKPVLAWFLQDAILFENFVLNDPQELRFTKNVFLPAFIDIYKETGYKPLIVDLLPTTVEHKKFWLCHPPDSKKHIESVTMI